MDRRSGANHPGLHWFPTADRESYSRNLPIHWHFRRQLYQYKAIPLKQNNTFVFPLQVKGETLALFSFTYDHIEGIEGMCGSDRIGTDRRSSIFLRTVVATHRYYLSNTFVLGTHSWSWCISNIDYECIHCTNARSRRKGTALCVGDRLQMLGNPKDRSIPLWSDHLRKDDIDTREHHNQTLDRDPFDGMCRSMLDRWGASMCRAEEWCHHVEWIQYHSGLCEDRTEVHECHGEWTQERKPSRAYSTTNKCLYWETAGVRLILFREKSERCWHKGNRRNINIAETVLHNFTKQIWFVYTPSCSSEVWFDRN